MALEKLKLENQKFSEQKAVTLEQIKIFKDQSKPAEILEGQYYEKQKLDEVKLHISKVILFL